MLLLVLHRALNASAVLAVLGALVSALVLGTLAVACRPEAKATGSSTPAANAARPSGVRSRSHENTQPSTQSSTSSASQAPDSGPSSDDSLEVAAKSAGVAAEPEHLPGRADRDPDNDADIGPPEVIVDCHEQLKAAGVTFTPSELPLRQRVRGIPTCGAHDAVVLKKGVTGLEYRPPALVTCHLALSLIDLERLLQEQAVEHFGSKVARVHQGGTYNCRKMARFDFVSEHSYGNAIDVRSFTLDNGIFVSVEKHFGKLDEPPSTHRARFLRTVGEQAFDRGIVSVSLGPYWDTLHRDHFHFDMARYRVDGSRP